MIGIAGRKASEETMGTGIINSLFGTIVNMKEGYSEVGLREYVYKNDIVMPLNLYHELGISPCERILGKLISNKLLSISLALFRIKICRPA